MVGWLAGGLYGWMEGWMDVIESIGIYNPRLVIYDDLSITIQDRIILFSRFFL